MEEKINYIIGMHPVIEAVKSGKKIEKVLFKSGLTGELFGELLTMLKERNISFQFVPMQRLNKISKGSHQGVIAQISAIDFISLETAIEESLSKNKAPLFVLLDGVSDVNIKDLIASHQKSGKLITMTAVQPMGRFGALTINEHDDITAFSEKPQGDGAWINGGFFVCQPEVMNYIDEGDGVVFEKKPLETLAAQGQLHAYKHTGFWQPMDTLKDKTQLTALWEQNKAPWKVWKD